MGENDIIFNYTQEITKILNYKPRLQYNPFGKDSFDVPIRC